MKSQLILVYLIFLVNGYEHIWYTFKNRHRIVFHSEDEERRRYNIFKKNLERIENHNRRYKDGQFAWYEDLNKFAVFNEDEFRETYLMHQVHKFSKNFTLHINERANIPQHIDWREKQLVTPVKNQGACGSCWSFSAVSTILIVLSCRLY
ncbi:hypothetical protein GWI33_008564 [Rhynchophorus ferrugineus]|uniref:Cathepsin propeptide inhibitor domain-containing protein n=1 Tax=Rhynchophorus ferrugineus TaxID=354439 RepID=A0A834ICU3_RHYFE|nr:hypothetical protein GWI33_008564 [Rhynchophorus ferrugineus]